MRANQVACLRNCSINFFFAMDPSFEEYVGRGGNTLRGLLCQLAQFTFVARRHILSS